MKLKKEDLRPVDYKVCCSKYLGMFAQIDKQASYQVINQIKEIYLSVNEDLRQVGGQVYWNIIYNVTNSDIIIEERLI